MDRPEQRKSFEICKKSIEKSPKPKAVGRKVWNQFLATSSNLFILRGSYSQAAARFGYMSRNKQSPATCIVAAVYGKIKRTCNWDKQDVDNILKIGDKLFRSTVFRLKMYGSRTSRIKPHCVLPTFYVNHTKLTISVEHDVFEIETSPQDKENFIKEISSKIENFLTKGESILLFVGNFGCTCWKSENSFFSFSPHDMDENGKVSGVKNQGKSAVLRSTKLEELLKYLFSNFVFFETIQIYAVKILKTLKLRNSECNFEIRDCKNDSNKQFHAKDDIKKFRQNSVRAPQNSIASFHEFDFGDECRESSMKMGANFLKISELKASLSSNKFMDDPDQIDFVNLAALILQKHVPTIHWTAQTLNDILKFGTEIYDDLDEPDFDDSLPLRTEYASKKFEFKFEKAIFGEILTERPEILDTKKGLRYFFAHHDVGLLRGPQNVAIWRECGMFYMFDAKERDTNGRKWTKLLTKGSGNLKNSGGACLTCYARIEDLAETYVENVPIKHQADPFRIIQVKLTEIADEFDDWYEWKAISSDGDQWCLMANMSLCDTIEEENGILGAEVCLAVATIAFKQIIPAEDWTAAILDEIIDVAQKFFNESSKERLKLVEASNIDSHEENELAEMHISGAISSPADVKKSIAVQEKSVYLKLAECLFSGVVSSTKSEEVQQNLAKGLKVFFANNMNGVLTTSRFCVAVWQDEDQFYYLADPFGSEALTSISKCFPTDDCYFQRLTVVRFEKLSNLCDYLLNHSRIQATDKYHISRLDALLSSETVRPYLENYSEFTNLGAILRPTQELHEGHSYFGARADRQTICNLFTCLSLTKINRALRWTQEDLVDILRIGDQIYCKISNTRKQCEFAITDLEMEHLKGFLKVGLNEFDFNTENKHGVFHIMEKSIDDPIIEVKEKQSLENILEKESSERSVEEPENLSKILSSWENQQEIAAVLKSDLFSVSLWKQDNLYFIFDPKATDDNGGRTPRRIFVSEQTIEKRKKSEERTEAEIQPQDGSGPEITSSAKSAKDFSNEGTAYCAWFCTLDSFVQHLLEKVPENFRNEPLTICKVNLSNKISEKKNPEPWHNFQFLNQGHLILKASMSQNDFMFANKGRQEITNSLIALAFAKATPVKNFTSTLLDDILKYGDRLHTKSLIILKEKNLEKFCSSQTKLEIEDIQRNFCIYNRKFELHLGKTASGEGNLEEHFTDLETIKDNKGYLLNLTDDYTICLWKLDKNDIYLFNPYETDREGKRSSKGGVASLSRFSDEKLAVDFIRVLACGRKNFRFKLNEIEICKETKESKCASQAMGDFKNPPAFSKLDENFHILRGTFSAQNCNKKGFLCCVATLIFSQIRFVAFWTRSAFEEISKISQNLRSNISNNDQTVSSYCPEIPENIEIDGKICHLEIDTIIRGPISTLGGSKEISLKKGFQQIFKICSSAILSTEKLTTAVWKECDKYFCVHLQTDGQRADEQTDCVILMTGSLENLLEYFEKIGDFKAAQNPWYQLRKCNVNVTKRKMIEKNKCAMDLKRRKTRVCAYKTITEDVELLKCCFLENIFEENLRLAYQSAACLVAAATSCVYTVGQWKNRMLVMIMKSAVKLLMQSVTAKESQVSTIHDLNQNLVLKNLFMVAEPLASSTKQIPQKENLMSVLNNILENSGITYIYTRDYCVCVISCKNLFYLFDPGYCHKSENGKSSRETASVLKFRTLSKTLDYLLQDVHKSAIHGCMEVGSIDCYVNQSQNKI